MYFGRTDEAIELPFWVVGRVGPRYHVLDGGPDPPREGAIFGGRGTWRNVTYRENAVPATRPIPKLLRDILFLLVFDFVPISVQQKLWILKQRPVGTMLFINLFTFPRLAYVGLLLANEYCKEAS